MRGKSFIGFWFGLVLGVWPGVNSPNTEAYPMFFKCDAEGQASDVVTPKELSAEMQKALTKNGLADFSTLAPCAGKDCEKELDRTILYIADNQARRIKGTDGTPLSKVMETYHADTRKKLNEKMDRYVSETLKLIEFPVTALEPVRLAAKAQARIQACRMAFRELEGGDFIHGDSLLFCAPHSDQYTEKIMGCMTLYGKKVCDLPRIDRLQRLVRDALIGGVDPYLYMAIGIMEKGPGGYFKHEIDPHSIPGAMGKLVGETETLRKVIYGKERAIKTGVTVDPDLSAKLLAAMEAGSFGSEPSKKSKSVISPTGKKYFVCYDVANGFSTSEAPKKGETCFDPGFTIEPNDRYAMKQRFEDVLTKDFMQKQFSKAEIKNGNGWKQVADALQGYNGRLPLYGSMERAPSRWRLGVNTIDNPVYGYQTMDIVLNSLMSNPVLNGIIEQAKSDLKEKKILEHFPKSIVCAQSEPEKLVYVDTDLFYKKINESRRFPGFEQKKWSSMSSLERFTMAQELSNPVVRGKLEETFKKKGKLLPADLYAPNFPEMQKPYALQMNSAQFLDAQGKVVRSAGVEIKLEDGKSVVSGSKFGVSDFFDRSEVARIEVRGKAGTFVYQKPDPESYRFTLTSVNPAGSKKRDDEVQDLLFWAGNEGTESAGQLELPDYSLIQGIKIQYNGESHKGIEDLKVRFTPGLRDLRPQAQVVSLDEVYETYKKTIYPESKTIFEVDQKGIRNPDGSYSESVWKGFIDRFDQPPEEAQHGGRKIIVIDNGEDIVPKDLPKPASGL